MPCRHKEVVKVEFCPYYALQTQRSSKVRVLPVICPADTKK
jgi:hypothetical protein